MKYAVIQTGGKQYKVAEGDIIEVESLGLAKDANLTFDTVLLYTTDTDVLIGNPNLSDVIISARVVDSIKGEKLRISKFKAKAKYRRTTGHRQSLTRVQIEAIGVKGEKKAKLAKEEPVVEKQVVKEEKTIKTQKKA